MNMRTVVVFVAGAAVGAILILVATWGVQYHQLPTVAALIAAPAVVALFVVPAAIAVACAAYLFSKGSQQ